MFSVLLDVEVYIHMINKYLCDDHMDWKCWARKPKRLKPPDKLWGHHCVNVHSHNVVIYTQHQSLLRPRHWLRAGNSSLTWRDHPHILQTHTHTHTRRLEEHYETWLLLIKMLWKFLFLMEEFSIKKHLVHSWNSVLYRVSVSSVLSGVLRRHTHSLIQVHTFTTELAAYWVIFTSFMI